MLFFLCVDVFLRSLLGDVLSVWCVIERGFSLTTGICHDTIYVGGVVATKSHVNVMFA